MCGIIGIVSPNKELLTNTLFSLLVESQIRGKHATGVSYLSQGKIVTLKAPLPAKDFLEFIPDDIGNVIIGHVRYSTSDINYNQPLQEDDVSIVHNGVITQAPFEQWEELYGYKDYKTKNDSEILLKRIASKGDMFEWMNFENSSIAAGGIIKDEIFCFRNTQRPLYLFSSSEDNIIGFASTENIIQRGTGHLNRVRIQEAEPMCIYNLHISDGQAKFAGVKKWEINETKYDLQSKPVRARNYIRGGSIKA